ncbi:MAG: hypothetical protein IKP53_03650, partial [Candidatus Methanomethylophilaceae archaeon]|nr:hypothetical protein [Candidatus Methanomethylophilaceae archaeon]
MNAVVRGDGRNYDFGIGTAIRDQGCHRGDLIHDLELEIAIEKQDGTRTLDRRVANCPETTDQIQ